MASVGTCDNCAEADKAERVSVSSSSGSSDSEPDESDDEDEIAKATERVVSDFAASDEPQIDDFIVVQHRKNKTIHHGKTVGALIELRCGRTFNVSTFAVRIDAPRFCWPRCKQCFATERSVQELSS